MLPREEIVAALVAAAGGELPGRIRIHASVYLLDRLGLNSGFAYDYRCGVRSDDLDNAIRDARVFGLIDEEERQPPHGGRYSVYRLTKPARSETYGALEADRARQLMALFLATPSAVLDLATAIDWIWRMERRPNWRQEIRVRRPILARDHAVEQATELLGRLDLTPPAPKAVTRLTPLPRDPDCCQAPVLLTEDEWDRIREALPVRSIGATTVPAEDGRLALVPVWYAGTFARGSFPEKGVRCPLRACDRFLCDRMRPATCCDEDRDQRSGARLSKNLAEA